MTELVTNIFFLLLSVVVGGVLVEIGRAHV